MWMLLVLFYGVLKGIREIVKKMALKKNSVIEVLFFYTFLAFLFVLPQAKDAGGLEPTAYIGIAAKAFCVFLAWIFSFRAIRRMPLSLYGVLDLSRVLFATLLGVVVMGETLGTMQTFGLIFVSSGLLLLKYKPSFLNRLFVKRADRGVNISEVSRNGQGNIEKKVLAGRTENVQIVELKNDSENVKPIYIFCAFFSCMMNALSGLLDKILMQDMSSSQLQFWYMLFLVSYYGIYMLVTRTKLSRDVWKNGWIWLLSILFVAADKALFIANGMADSRITIMTLLKQSGCVVAILAGKLIFKEKNISYKLFCAGIIVLGIVIGVM